MEEGTFLLRKSTAEGQNNNNVLSFAINKMVYHVNVVQLGNNSLELGGVPIKLKTITELVDHFRVVAILANVKLSQAPKIVIPFQEEEEEKEDTQHTCQR
jgi:hypothetical protein